MKKIFEIGFKRPKLLGLGDNPPLRSATPFELFFDLAFVVAMSHLVGYLENNLNYASFFYIALKFITIFIFWNSITMYNQYFEDNTIIHRLIIFFSMIPILFLSIDDKLAYDSLLLYTISFMVSRIYIIVIWIWSTYKTSNLYLNKIVRIYYMTNGLSLFAITLALIFLLINQYTLCSLMWIMAIFIEIVYPIFMTNKVNKKVDFNDPNVPVFDRKLQMERSTLFTILILGEGLVGTSRFINELYAGHNEAIFKAFFLFLITFLILWVYMDYYSSYTIRQDHFLNLNYLNIFQALGSFLVVVGFITLFEHDGMISQQIIAVGLFCFGITNIVIDKYRGEFIQEKYEYSNTDFKEGELDFEKLNFIVVRKSFYLEIIFSIIFIFWQLNIYIIALSVLLILIINIFLLVNTWISYIEQ